MITTTVIVGDGDGAALGDGVGSAVATTAATTSAQHLVLSKLVAGMQPVADPSDDPPNAIE